MANMGKVTLYLDRDLTENAKAALKESGSSLSEFFNAILEEMLPAIEASAYGEGMEDSSVVGMSYEVAANIMAQGKRLGELIRTFEEELEKRGQETNA